MQFKRFHLAAAAGLWLCASAGAAPLAPQASAPTLGRLPNYPVAPQQRARALDAAQQGVAVGELAPGAPSRYTVRHGDTLWKLSGMYLRKPWNWPLLWGMNLAQIRNPHWIFPGQVLVLHVAGGRAWLSSEAGSDLPTVRLEPGVRAEPLAPAGIPTLDPLVIGSFLTRALIVEPDQLARSPRIVALQPGQMMLAPGQTAYVGGELGEATRFEVYRPAQPLHEPGSKRIIAWQSRYLGSVRLVQPPQGKDAVATVAVHDMVRDIEVGDRLIAQPPNQHLDFTPHAPSHAVSGTILAVYGDVSMAGRNGVVVIDRGHAQGVERGDVLVIDRPPRQVDDATLAKPEPIELPAQRAGLAMVFRTFRDVSYALVLEASQEVVAGDTVAQP